MILITLLISQASALIINTALATSFFSDNNLQRQLPPQATPLPQFRRLDARQQSALATCGFINGDSAKPVTCGSSLYCATTSTFVGCCPLSNCRDIFTACYDLLGSTCDDACQDNPQNLVCPTALPYCARYNYEGGSVGLGCASIRGYTSTVLLTTKAPLSSLVTNTSTSAPTTSSTTTPISSAAPSSGKGSLSTGATAGIAVGATICAIGLLLLAWYLCRKSLVKRRLEREEAANAARRSEVRTSVISEIDSKPPVVQHYRYSPLQQSPPHYTERFANNPVEMPESDRARSYEPTELSSTRN